MSEMAVVEGREQELRATAAAEACNGSLGKTAIGCSWGRYYDRRLRRADAKSKATVPDSHPAYRCPAPESDGYDG
jgi:hypothetical protein